MCGLDLLRDPCAAVRGISVKLYTLCFHIPSFLLRFLVTRKPCNTHRTETENSTKDGPQPLHRYIFRFEWGEIFQNVKWCRRDIVNVLNLIQFKWYWMIKLDNTYIDKALYFSWVTGISKFDKIKTNVLIQLIPTFKALGSSSYRFYNKNTLVGQTASGCGHCSTHCGGDCCSRVGLRHAAFDVLNK